MSSRSSLRKQWFQPGIMPSLCAALIVLSCPGFLPQPIIAQHGMRSVSESGDLECVSYCSSVRPGTLIIEVKLRLSDHSLDEANLRSAVRQQRLEVTVYSEGFERGLYATVSALKPKEMFRMRTNAGSPNRAKLSGLEKLVIAGVATRLDQQAAGSFLLMQPDLTPRPPGTAESEWVNVRVEGLEPGVAYTFRSSGKSVVTCHAASCPFDELRPPKNRAIRKSKTKR